MFFLAVGIFGNGQNGFFRSQSNHRPAGNLRNQVSDEEKLANKLDEDDKNTISEAVKEVIEWLDENPAADKEDYEEKQKELQNKVNPIIGKVYQGAGGAGEAEDEPVDDELWGKK